jgi:Holliday junction resolvase RusA-like endonuclease
VVTFTVPGRLKGKARPKVYFRDKSGRPLPFPRAVTPADTVKAELSLAQIASQAMSQAGLRPMLGAVSLTVSMRMMPAPSWTKKKLAAAHYVTGKPDFDNVLKLIGDALNGVVWKDDSQIAQIAMVRYYRRDEEEQTTITATEIGLEERLV